MFADREHNRNPWALSSAAAIFYCVAAEEWFESIGAPNGAPAFAAIVASHLWNAAIAMWVVIDARQRRRALLYDFPFWVFVLPHFFAVYYVFSTRGVRAFIVIGQNLMLCFAGALLGKLPLIVRFFAQPQNV